MLRRLNERLEGWRTVIFGSLVTFSCGLLPVLDLLRAIDLGTLFTPRTATLIGVGLGILTIILRFATTTSVGVKPEGDQ